jgi:hypothetical protein
MLWGHSFQRTSPELSCLLSRLLSRSSPPSSCPPCTSPRSQAPTLPFKRTETSSPKRSQLRTICLQSFKSATQYKGNGSCLDTHGLRASPRDYPDPGKTARKRAVATSACPCTSGNGPDQSACGNLESRIPLSHSVFSQNVVESSWALSTNVVGSSDDSTIPIPSMNPHVDRPTSGYAVSRNPSQSTSKYECFMGPTECSQLLLHGLRPGATGRGMSAPANRACMRTHARLAETALSWQATLAESPKETCSSSGSHVVASQIRGGWEERSGNRGFFEGKTRTRLQGYPGPRHRELPETCFEVVWHGAVGDRVPGGSGFQARVPSAVQVVRAVGAKNAAVAGSQIAQMLRQSGQERQGRSREEHVWGGVRAQRQGVGRISKVGFVGQKGVQGAGSDGGHADVPLLLKPPDD